MKKARNSESPELPAEVDFTGGERGRYAARYAEGTNLVVLAPDLAKVFPDSESVNTALRVLVRAGQRARQLRTERRRAE